MTTRTHADKLNAIRAKKALLRLKVKGISNAYDGRRNTVSCYSLDPEGNRLEIYALVSERNEARINRDLDLAKSVEEIVAQANGQPHARP